MKNIKEFAEVVKTRRKEKYLTQQQLANESTVGVATIRDLERGQLKDIKLSTIRKLFNTLNIKFKIK